MQELEKFLQSWNPEDSPETREFFMRLYREAKKCPGVTLSSAGRPGYNYSLRLASTKAAPGTFFAIIDIVDDDPDERWLNIRLDAELADDPDGRGETIPQALNNEDALCFEVDENDEELSAYISSILRRTAKKAVK